MAFPGVEEIFHGKPVELPDGTIVDCGPGDGEPADPDAPDSGEFPKPSPGVGEDTPPAPRR